MPGPDALDDLLDDAAAALEEGEPEEALARAEEAVAQAPRSVPALHLRAAALAALDRLDDAAEAYERALERGRDDPELLAGAADFHLNVLADEDTARERAERALELARRGSRAARKLDDPDLAADLAYLEGAALDQLGRADEALVRLEEAARLAPDRVEILLEQAFALYELSRLDDARAVLLRAEALDRKDPWVHHQLGLVAERLGDAAEATRRFARARKLAPEEFPEPVSLTHEAFDAAVEAALERLPEPVRRYLSNVAITVEDLPQDDDLRGSVPPLSPAILGLFRGAPWGQKASMDPWSHFPSSIVLYQKNLERFARSREELVEEIGVTLVHEVGHFLGLDEEELWERGLD